MRYNAFLSYSHATDGKLAPALQIALHRLAKPLFKLRALSVFRDKTNLSANSALWPSIENALSESEYFLFLASPEAAKSSWVQKEVGWWLKHRSAEKLFVLVTDGEIVWDEAEGDFDWKQTTALPEILRRQFVAEPHWVDLRWVRDAENLSLLHSRFHANVLDVAAPLHGKPKDELDGEDVREARNVKRLTRWTVGTLSALTIGLGLTTFFAVKQKHIAISRELTTTATIQLNIDPAQSMQLALDAVNAAPTEQAELILRKSLSLNHTRVVLGGRNFPVSAVKVSTDGKQAITLSDHDKLGIWDTTTGDLLHKLEKKYVSFYGSAFDSAGKVLVVADDLNTKTKQILDAHTGKSLVELQSTPTSIVNFAEFSPDGRSVAMTIRAVRVINPDGTAAFKELSKANYSTGIWDTRSGEKLSEIQEQGRPNYTFSPNGKLLITTKDNVSNSARIWDVRTGKLLTQLPESKSAVYSAAFSPDSSLVVTASPDKTARICDARTGKVLTKLQEHTGKVISAVFSPDSTRVVTTSTDKTALVWNTQSGKRQTKLQGHTGDVLSAEFSSDGRLVVTASNDGTSRIWDAHSGESLLELRGDKGSARSATFSPDCKFVITIGYYNTARIWDISHVHRRVELHGHKEEVWSTAFNSNGSQVITASVDGTARVWDIHSGKSLVELQGHTYTSLMPCAIFSPDGRLLVTAGKDNTASIWNTRSNKRLTVLRGHTGSVTGAAFSRDGGLVVTVSNYEKTARVWNVQTGKQKIKLGPYERHISSAAFSPNAQLVATAGDSTTRIWDIHSGKCRAELKVSEVTITSNATFSPDGKLVATATFPNPYIWDSQSGKRLVEFEELKDFIRIMTFSPDSKKVIVAGHGGTAFIYDARTGKRQTELRGHKSHVLSADFSPDSRLVVTTGYDKTTRIWDSRSGQSLLVLRGGGMSAAFSPDGKSIITANGDSARIYPCDVGGSVDDLVKLARQRAIRPLPPTAWNRFQYMVRDMLEKTQNP